MSFPATAQDLIAELHLAGGWRDVTGHVLQRGGLNIQRGLSSEDNTGSASTCAFELDNTSRDYNPRNPVGQWFGSIGRNTPFRLSLGLGTDTFTRTVSNGWGTSEIVHNGSALTWSSTRNSGTAADHAVSGGKATHTISGTVAWRADYLGSVSRSRVDVAVSVTLSASDVTGGDLEPANLLLGGVSTGDYHMVRVVITTSEAVTVRLMHADGTSYSDTVTVPGITYVGGMTLRVRAQMEGAGLRAKVWNIAAGEPAGWHVSAGVGSKGPARRGWVGVRSGVGGGNTNVPVTFFYDDVAIRSPRHAGEVPTWEPHRDGTGQDRYVRVEASGILRRLSQGESPLQSALRRASVSAGAVAYWPCEDGSEAREIASALAGDESCRITGSPNLASSTSFACSDRLPVMRDGSFDAWTTPYPATGQLQMRCLLEISVSDPPVNDAIIARLYTSGSLFWQVVYGTGGTLRLEGCRDEATIPVSSGSVPFGIDGKSIRVSVELTQTGADIEWDLAYLEVGQFTGFVLSGTATGYTLGAATRVWVAPQRNLDSTVLGHVLVQNQITGLFDLKAQLNAHVGETAVARTTRLCAENAIPVITHGDAAYSTAMGAQSVSTLLNLLAECARADAGVLHEAAGDVALSYIARDSLYNQPAAVTIDFGGHELQPGWEPREDDRTTRNDVSVRRRDGSYARAVLETGPMSTAPASEGGVGRYDTDDTVNVEHDGLLADLAGWALHLGTVDEPRYTSIRVLREASSVAANATLSDALLDLDVGARVVVTNVSSADIYDDVTQLVVGYEEYIGRFQHQVAITGRPESPYHVVDLDDGELDRLDSDSSRLAEDLDTIETDIDVVTSNPTELWTTSAADCPFDIRIGGEVMTVTAVSGSSSPQTFTVLRNANNVVKTHQAGAGVRLAQPSYLAL
ncbi:hypothetical protein [Actinosynnema sp. NPDC023587]|uniref:hypothetical protein n=1 Tax=Actinosynnema sp. NPDC023587 TaxID=3154695 RepID=UPI0033F50475